MNYRAKILLATLISCSSLPSLAQSPDILQDCLLEGKIVADKAQDGANVVRIDFYKAEPFKPEHRCIIDGALNFTQPKGSIIENLSVGSIVQYHYMKMTNGQTSWQLVGAFI